MLTYLWVAAGGALGSVARFWLAGAVARLAGVAFPWGTVLINIAGSLAIGVFAGLSLQNRVVPAADLRAFLMAGLCGGFTTFSAFSLQTVEMLREGRMGVAAAHVVGSVVLCVAASWFGFALTRS